MAVTNKKTFAITLCSLGSMNSAFGEMLEAGKTKLKTVFNIYHQNSNDGQQVFDNSGREEANVVEPMIFIETQINEDTAVSGHFVFDGWTAASDTRLDSRTGASSSSATITTQGRGSGNIGLRKEQDSLNYGVNFGVSSEYDYRSLNVSLNVSESFAKDNFTLGASVQYYMDEVDLFEDLSDSGSALISEGKARDILATSVSATQILTAKDLIQFELLYSQSQGVLESTANTVKVAGVRKVEKLPENRNRYAVSSKWVHGIGEDSAINLSLRYYKDSWDLSAITTRLAYLKEINDDEDFVELFLRHHKQDEAEYYKDSFDSDLNNMTSDSDMASFDFLETGIYHTKTLPDFKLIIFDFENIIWSNSFVLGYRSNGMRMGYYQSGLGVEF